MERRLRAEYANADPLVCPAIERGGVAGPWGAKPATVEGALHKQPAKPMALSIATAPRSVFRLHPRPLYHPVKVSARRIPTPAFPAAALDTAGHANKVRGCARGRSGEVWIRDRRGDGALAPVAVQCAGTGSRILRPRASGVVVAFGVNDARGVARNTEGGLDRMCVGAGAVGIDETCLSG
jgi:hypothetical protein